MKETEPMKSKKSIVTVLLLISAASANAYTIENVKWNPGIVPFYLNLGQFNSVAVRELAAWDQYTGNTYLRRTNNAATNGSDIWFMDGRDSIVWSDSVGYDLPGNILGVCAFDTRGSHGNFTSTLREADIVLNSDFTWSDGQGGPGYDIGWVLLHELGHAIGLGHSTNFNAVMSPYYFGNPATLTADDIAGAQSIYGPRTLTGSVPDSGSTAALLAFAIGALFAIRKQQTN